MGAKVLVVEDERTLLETLEYNLARQGYEAFTAAPTRIVTVRGIGYRFEG